MYLNRKRLMITHEADYATGGFYPPEDDVLQRKCFGLLE